MANRNTTRERAKPIVTEETFYTIQQIADILKIGYSGAQTRLARAGIKKAKIVSGVGYYTTSQLERIKVKNITTVSTEIVYYIYESKINRE